MWLTAGRDAEAPPKTHRNKPSSHTILAGGGGETEKDISKVVCGKSISKERQGFSMSCRFELVEGPSQWLPLPQREALAEDVHPSHGCDRCEFVAQLL